LRFEWDEAKRRSNIAKHGFNFADVGPAFIDPHRVVYPAIGRGFSEARWVLLGQIDGQVMHIVFTLRMGRIRIISVCRAHIKERYIYD
jgi:uncharacterized DUF497 family protein